MDDSAHDSARMHFATTHWSLVLTAKDHGDQASRAALECLCSTYWYPLYAYVRPRVRGPEEAKDLTQAFFCHLLEKQGIGKADPERGRFRSFLLASLKNFMNNAREREKAQKRGGGRVLLTIDMEKGESRFLGEPFHTLTPEKQFNRTWVMALLDQVLSMLGEELDKQGKARHFVLFKGSLTDESTPEELRLASEALGISPAAAKQAAYRLRKRYRELFRLEVARTLAPGEDVDSEIGRLLNGLA